MNTDEHAQEFSMSTAHITTPAHLAVACAIVDKAKNDAGKATLIAFAKRKGGAFLKALPESWNIPDGDNDADDKGMNEPQMYVGATISNTNMQHIQQAHDHLRQASGHLQKLGVKGGFPPSPEQIGAMTNHDLSEDFAGEHADFMRMSEEPDNPDHHTIAFTMPHWFGEADAPPEWVPYLPKPTTFSHAKYGTVTLTPERNANFVSQFNTGIYQKPIALDGEHMSKVSGAMAWVYALRKNDDHSVDAQVKWTPRGEKMYREGSFKYISPEFYDKWPDPATGEVYSDVAIGGALTTRPFFKASHLRPLAASEDHARTPDEGEGGSGMTVTTEVSAEQFTELRDKHATLEQQFAEVATERDALKAVADQNEARIAALEADARTKRFSEIVTGWTGDKTTNIARLEKVAERFGEDSDDFKEEVRERRSFAEQVKMTSKTGSIFADIGSSQGAETDSSAGRLHAMATERAEKKGITYAKAYSEVLEEKPELYEG